MARISSRRIMYSVVLRPPPPYSFFQVGQVHPLLAMRSNQSSVSVFVIGIFELPECTWPVPRAPIGQLVFNHARVSSRNSLTSGICLCLVYSGLYLTSKIRCLGMCDGVSNYMEGRRYSLLMQICAIGEMCVS